MSISIDTSELAALRASMDRATLRVGAKGAQIIRAGAAKMERGMKSRAKVDTGAMRNSVSSSILGDGRSTAIVAEVGPSVDYAVYVNNGTSRMTGDDFVGKSFDEVIPGVLAAAAQLGDELL